ncbi:MAG TPA: type III-B CRISPR module RAMP protein Cmr6 [Ktedonobacteraceae bacterium]|jgi:CRISPR-associated protein Cmr6|nr:type III-B CRISPR module RAMP protein Cmr6 [Ktedonobacteraceae bacterium]
MSTRRDSLSSIQLSHVSDAHAELWLDRYMDDVEKSEKRSAFVAEVSTISIPTIYETFYNRWIQELESLGAKKREAHVKTRMIVGLGDESVLETSVTLHKTYGVPYIPGSALKGLAASYARQRLTEDWQKGREAYQVIFGDPDEAGYITFFDALYIPEPGTKKRVLYPDVISTHHQKYYQNFAQTPADWDDPIPIPFLTATGDYMIALAAPELNERDAWIEKTFTILKYALADMGIGAKTSSGYGRLELK